LLAGGVSGGLTATATLGTQALMTTALRDSFTSPAARAIWDQGIPSGTSWAVAIPMGVLFGSLGGARAVELRNAGMIGQIVDTPDGPARIVAITRGGVVVLEPPAGLRVPPPAPPPSEIVLVFDPETGVWRAPGGTGSALATVPRAPSASTAVTTPRSTSVTRGPGPVVPRSALPVPVELAPPPRRPGDPVVDTALTAPPALTATTVAPAPTTTTAPAPTTTVAPAPTGVSPAPVVATPSTPGTVAADARVAATGDALAAATREAAPARARVDSARLDVAAARELAAEPGNAAAGARLVRDAEASLRRAEAQLRPRELSEAVARREAAEAARARAEIVRLDGEIARLNRLIDAELNPPGGFTVEQVREGRRPWLVPVAEPRLQPSGREYHRLVGLRTVAERQLRGEVAALTHSLADQVTAATPGRAARPVALANAAALDAALRPVGGRPIDVTTGRPMTTSAWATDHLVSRSEIARDPRFARLSPLDREDLLLNVPENYLPMTVEANSSKGALSVDEWIAARAADGRPLPPAMAAALRAADVRARAAVEERFRQLGSR
jgi:hypothetical protein